MTFKILCDTCIFGESKVHRYREWYFGTFRWIEKLEYYCNKSERYIRKLRTRCKWYQDQTLRAFGEFKETIDYFDRESLHEIEYEVKQIGKG